MMRHRCHKCPSEPHPQMTTILLEGIFVIWNRGASQLSPWRSKGWISKRDFPEGQGEPTEPAPGQLQKPHLPQLPNFPMFLLPTVDQKSLRDTRSRTLHPSLSRTRGAGPIFRRRMPRSPS